MPRRAEFVGCWRILQVAVGESPAREPPGPLRDPRAQVEAAEGVAEAGGSCTP
jgi:hypothetical protein